MSSGGERNNLFFYKKKLKIKLLLYPYINLGKQKVMIFCSLLLYASVFIF